MHPDRVLFPPLSQYLDESPERIVSYPAIYTKADSSFLLRTQLAPGLAAADMPPGLRGLLTQPWQPGEWLPTINYAVPCAFARDRNFLTVFGPSLVAMSAAKRWHTLQSGTELVVKKQTKQSVHLLLTLPLKLFLRSGRRAWGAFCAIAQSSRGTDPTFFRIKAYLKRLRRCCARTCRNTSRCRLGQLPLRVCAQVDPQCLLRRGWSLGPRPWQARVAPSYRKQA